MLNYQKLDGKINELKKTIDNAEELDLMSKMSAHVKDAQTQSANLESTAKKLIDDYEELKNLHDTNTNQLNNLIKNDVSSLDKEELDDYIKNVNELSSELFMLERNFNLLVSKINEQLKSFEATARRAKRARDKHQEVRAKYEARQKEITPKMEELQKELKKLEKSVPAELLEKYKTVKGDGIFPVFVPLVDKGCGYCRMQIASAKLDILLANDHIPCEHCRRVIYNLPS